MKLIRFVLFLPIALAVINSAQSSPAWAQIEYVPPQGEAPDYEKKYRPTEVSVDWIIELNPLLLLNRGLALEMEHRIAEIYTLGADVLYSDATVFESDAGVKGRSLSFGLLPKVRLYPLPVLSGVFFGFKLFLGVVNSEISGESQSHSETHFMVSPTVHVGYRITSFRGVTFSLYVGGGANVPPVEVAEEEWPTEVRGNSEWKDAANRINQNESLFRPDFGLTLGVAL